MTSTKRFYCEEDDDDEGLPPSPASTTQTDFFDYLQLGVVKKVISIKPCSVMIIGSKCSICKREFKCVTDTRRHMRKKHKYVKRKADKKLVRIKLKMGKETFCDNTISKKFLRTPERGSNAVALQSINDSQPLQVSDICCPNSKENNVSPNLSVKCSVPLSAALFDIKSLDQSAVYKNGRVYKERSDSNQLNCAFSNGIRIEDDCDSDDTWDLNSGSASDSENTVIYVSDVEVDLSEFYEDIKVEKVESDIEDAETVVMSNGELDTNLEDLDDLSPENLEAMGKTCEDMDLVHMYDNNFGIFDNFVNLAKYCQELERAEVVNPGETDIEQSAKGNEGNLSRKRPHEVETIQSEASEAKSSRKSLESKETEQKERKPKKYRVKNTENTLKLMTEISEIFKDISKVESARKNLKRIENTQRNSRESDNTRRCSKDAETTRRGSKDDETTHRDSREFDNTRRNSRESGNTRRDSRDAETTRRASKDAEATQRDCLEAESTQTDPKGQKFIGIRLKRLDPTPIQENRWKAQRIEGQEVIETISNDLEIVEPLLEASKTKTSVQLNSTPLKLEPDNLDISDEDLKGIHIGCPSFEDVEKVRQRLEARDNNLVDLTETDSLETSEVTFSLVVQNVGENMKNFKDSEDDVIIIDDIDDKEQTQPQLEDFLKAAVIKYVQQCRENSSSFFDTINNNNNNVLRNLKHSSKINYHLKKALMELGITIAAPSPLIKDEIK